MKKEKLTKIEKIAVKIAESRFFAVKNDEPDEDGLCVDYSPAAKAIVKRILESAEIELRASQYTIQTAKNYLRNETVISAEQKANITIYRATEVLESLQEWRKGNTDKRLSDNMDEEKNALKMAERICSPAVSKVIKRYRRYIDSGSPFRNTPTALEITEALDAGIKELHNF